MSIRIERDRLANVIKFHGSSTPIHPNNVLTAQVNADDVDRVDIYNSVGGTDFYEYYAIHHSEFVRADNTVFGGATAVVDYVNAAANASGKSNGYHFHNSEFYLAGHAGSSDVIVDVEEGIETTVKVTSTTPTEFGTELPEGLVTPYDTATGLYTLTNFEPDDLMQFRFAIDIDCNSDESTADVILECNSPLGFTFKIEEQLLSMNAGAGEYIGLATIPVFVGDSLADNGTPATILPKVKLKSTTGDIKPRSFTLFVWR